MRVCDLLTKEVPIAAEKQSAGFALQLLRECSFDEVDHVYLVDANHSLTGQVPLQALVKADPASELALLKGSDPVEVSPDEYAERAALLAIENHDADVAVVDKDRHLVGAIPVTHLLTFLHKRHIDHILRHGGIRANHRYLLDQPTLSQAVKSRLPWLVLGLGGGILTGAMASSFENSLRLEISLTFFLPLVVYMSDAIGTQTETLVIRRLASRKMSPAAEIVSEGLTGLTIGLVIGVLAMVSLYLFTGKAAVAAVVGLAVLSSAIVASVIASSLPLMLTALRFDPAAASGPVATIIQDFLSVAIYLAIGTLLL
jgi:magnesium transporter